MFRFPAAAFAAVLLICVPAVSSPLTEAIDNYNVVAIEELSRNTHGDEKLLAEGTMLALRHKDEAAIAVLAPLAKSGADKELRSYALGILAGIYVVQGRYAECYEVQAAADELSAEGPSAQGKQGLEFVKALHDVAPMRLLTPASGKVPVRRDEVGLMRIPVGINGGEQEILVDTGSAFSVLNASAAKRLGIRMLQADVSMTSSTRDALATQLGVADKLTIGSAVLTDVVFIVLPDEALITGSYKIDAILGLPVMVSLERIEVAKEAGQEVLYYGPRKGSKPLPANLILQGTKPYVQAHAGEASLLMFLDTGARRSMLTSKLVKDYPALTAAAKKETARWNGAGGDMVDENALKLPEFTYDIGGKAVTLKGITIASQEVKDNHGAIGQDVLTQGKSWVLDFEAMRLTVLD